MKRVLFAVIAAAAAVIFFNIKAYAVETIIESAPKEIISQPLEENYYIESPSGVDYRNFPFNKIEDSLFVIRVQMQAELPVKEGLGIHRYIASTEQSGTAIAIDNHLWTLYHIVHAESVLTAGEIGVFKNDYWRGVPRKILRETFSVVDPDAGELFVDVEEIYSDKALDMAFFKYPQNSFIKEFPVKMGDPTKLRFGDYLEVCGKPDGFKRVVCRQARVRLSGPMFEGDINEGPRFIINNIIVIEGNVYYGDSGSPVFAFNQKGEPELVGLIQAVYEGTPVIGLMLRIDVLKWWFEAMVKAHTETDKK